MDMPDDLSGLLLLADTLEIVASNPSLWHSPLEVDLRLLGHPWSAPVAKAKRSRWESSDDLTGKICKREEDICKKKKKKIGGRGDQSSDGFTGKKPGKEKGICKKKEKIGRTLCGSSLPVEVREKIRDAMSGTDVKLILQKELTKSDYNPNLGRFSIPSSHVLTDFLDQEEHRLLENGGLIKVPVIEPLLGVSHPTLKMWKMSTKPVYVLTTGWNTLARKNFLQAGDLIQVWSFRTEGRIGLAIVKCDTGSHHPPSPSSVLEFHRADQEPLSSGRDHICLR